MPMAKPPRRAPCAALLALLTYGLVPAACTAGDVNSAGRAAPASGVPTASVPPVAAPSTAAPTAGAIGAACGYNNTGKLVHMADAIDICIPATVCTAEVCPAALGSCVDGQCVFKPGYKGLQTLPQGWATYYCRLSTGSCNGITQVEPPQNTAKKLGTLLGLPLCEGAAAGAECVGIAASSPMMVGNSQIAKDARSGAYIRPWGLGLSEAANVCYQVTGPGGTAHVALTDRCGGYCSCGGSGPAECAPCVNAPDMAPNCPCVGSAPGLADACCGPGCPTTAPACDWCASNNHPHFDFDESTFNHVCGADAVRGSCQLTRVAAINCPLGVAWPPP